ncbi:MAG: endonuclease III, partial [Gemmatimonadota bacterium]|nr:endonuclease III [Gemmatimonadota bacterium]
MAARRTLKTTGLKPSQRAPLVARSPRTRAGRQHIANIVLQRLTSEYPDATCALVHRNAFELLVATIL